jgi:DNA polymerase delta subunit 3
MDEYKKYLAERLFTEDKMVTYRTLSRALKVHVNSAKA